jgi:hypothetical protein
VFGTVVLALGCTIVHGTLRRLHSPFGSTLTSFISEGYMRSLDVLSRGLHALYLRLPSSALDPHIRSAYEGVRAHITHVQAYGILDLSKVDTYHIKAYHSIMSQTYDDSLLDDGSSALKAILQVTLDAGENASAQSMMNLVAYLFTPAASRRSAMTAARAIYDYKPSEPGKQSNGRDIRMILNSVSL